MHGIGNDYIYFDNRDGKITCPESIAINYVNIHYGIGGDGIVLIENSDVADAKMRIFNKDGTEGRVGGNAVRCVGKYLYEKGIVRNREMKIETAGGINAVKVYSFNGKVNSASVNLGKAELAGDKIPCVWKEDQIVDKPVKIGGKDYRITLVNLGNPHCVVFSEKVDAVDVATVGPLFENCEYFPERINAEFIRVVNKVTIKMRVWERGNATERLHFHALVYIPAGQMIGELFEQRDYSTKQKRMQTTIQNTHFNDKFGRTDFEVITTDNHLTECYYYLKKYMEKSGEKLIVSRNCPTHFNLSVFKDDIICPLENNEYKQILADDFKCVNADGEIIENITREKLLALADEKRL